MKLFEKAIQGKAISPRPPPLPNTVLQIKWNSAVCFCDTAARTTLKEKAYTPKVV